MARLRLLTTLAIIAGVTSSSPLFAQCKVHEDAKLTAADGAAGDVFGSSVSISGDTMVVGAPRDDGDRGSAYVLVRSAGTWTQTAKLTASDGASGDLFGDSVAVSGGTVVVGAYGDDMRQGSAYVFVKPGGGWSDMTQTAKLTESAGAEGEIFGWSVAVSGDTVVVGAPADGIGVENPQGAYVFVKPGGGWSDMTETAKLTASDGYVFDFLGASVAVSGNTVVVGASDDAIGPNIGPNSGQGSVYVFVEPGGGWADMTQTAKLTASDGAHNDYLGVSVAVSGDTVVAGAYQDDIGPNSDQGSAYVFVKPGGGWADMTETAKLTASDGAAVDYFGYWNSVAVSGDTVVVGAPLNDVGSNVQQGSAYVFVKSGGGWSDMTETAKFTASDGAGGENFGVSVGVSGDTVVGGDAGADIAPNANQGSVYVFDLSGPDCNGNGIFDSCDIATGTSPDCNSNGVPDECEADCNSNAIPDECDIATGTSADCNRNGVPDECDITACAGDPACGDCNANLVPDGCDIASGTTADCNANGIPDACDIANCPGDPVCADCNANSIPDGCEADCNSNAIPDECDIRAGVSRDADANGVPDECETGACCDGNTGLCADDVPMGLCSGNRRSWSVNALCAERDPACLAPVGACCDRDSFGDCTDGLTRAECSCARCEWTEDALCADVACPRDSIPTVSSWGLAILSLLLMTGAKVRFGWIRRS